MSGSQVQGQKKEAGPAAAAPTAAAAGCHDDSDQRREEGEPRAGHLWRIREPFRGQDRPGGAAVKGRLRPDHGGSGAWKCSFLITRCSDP